MNRHEKKNTYNAYSFLQKHKDLCPEYTKKSFCSIIRHTRKTGQRCEWALHKEEMVNEHVKRRPSSYVIGETQTRAARETSKHPSEQLRWRLPTTERAGEAAGPWGSLCWASGGGEWKERFANTVWTYLKNYPLQAYDKAIPLPDIYPGPKAGMPTDVPAALGGMVLSWNPPRVRQHLPRRTAHLL